jgi:hypothetical protein
MEVKDDRPPESLSFAATNLVKPGLSSKRQQSEPPLNRNVFPPTPPPESERTASGANSFTGSAANGMSRGASVRNGPKPLPPMLNIEKARPKQTYEIRDEQISEEPRRLGTQRAASEARIPPRRREPAPQTWRKIPEEAAEDEYPSELYDMYRNSRGARSNGGRPKNQPQYIEEEEEDASEYDDGSFDEQDFEMVSNRPPAPRATRSSSQSRASSRRPDIRKVRVKVHAAEDTRYIMIGIAIEFPDLVDRIRDKFAIRKRFKIKVRDDDMPDGDMITMGDQDDLEMAMMSVKSNAKKERLDMGKMEVSCLTFGLSENIY